MRKALLLLAIAAAAAADDAAIDKARALAKAGPDAAREWIPELIALGKGSAPQRFAARDALVVAGPHAIAPLIEGASGDASLRLLLEGVSFDLGAAVVARALPLLAADDPKVRAAAAVCLGAAGRGGEAAVKKLIEALYDKDVAVRREAATALGRIGRGAHDAAPALILLANDRERGAAREAILALGMILRDAAERERPKPDVPPDVVRAIEKGLAWLAAHQEPDGLWPVPAAGDAPAPERARAHVGSLVLLALLDSGRPNGDPPTLRAAWRRLVTHASAGDYSETITATLCAAARVLREPECEAAAEQAVTALATDSATPGPPHWYAVAELEARFVGLLLDPGLRGRSDAVSLVSDELRGWVEDRAQAGPLVPEWQALAARVQWYRGLKSEALEATLKAQREDGSWDEGGKAPRPVHTTACMLLVLEAGSGLAHPLTMPLPDAPQLKAAVATLRIAAQSRIEEIRAAAEQALAGFAR